MVLWLLKNCPEYCSIKTTNYQELGKAIEFASNEVTERKYLELVYSLLLLYVIFMRKAISLFSVTIIFNNSCSLPLSCERRAPP
jgi:hypothetical protein